MGAMPGYADALVREFELPRLGTLGLRLRVWCTSSRLTRELAAGASPVGSRELALRARQVTDRRTRALLAASMEDLVHQAQGSRAPFSSQVQLDRAKVGLVWVPLLELAERLRAHEPVAACGMAQVLLLLTDPELSLYGDGGALELAAAIVEARQMLDGLPESTLEL
jgi:hypothetical protein